MRAIVILIVAAVLGFFGYQYAANGKAPADAIGALTGVATDMAGDAAEMAGDAAATATDAVSDAAAAVEDAVEGAVEGATEMADDATAAAATAEAAEIAEAGATQMSDLLTPEGFDAGKVMEMIDGSDLSAVQKTALSGAVNAVKDNPALLEATLTRLKEALGF